MITIGAIPLENTPLICRTGLRWAAIIALFAIPQALPAQAPARGWVVPISPALYAGIAEPSPSSRDSVELPRTYWKEGAVIGGATLGTVALVVSLGACADTDSVQEDDRAGCVLGTSAVSALLGATIGALIGGQIRSGPPNSEQAQARP